MAIVAQLVRALDCESRGHGFDPHHSPQIYGITGRMSIYFLTIYFLTFLRNGRNKISQRGVWKPA